MNFFLGTHEIHWLWKVDIPLFVSRRRLEKRKNFKPATCDWALDSGGFTELNMFGQWVVTEEQYIEEINRFKQMGRLQWCAPQDWMCEPFVLKKTKKTVQDHQRLTIQNYLSLKSKAPDLPFVPVLQGWNIEDYLRHWEAYEKAGVHLEDHKVVGVGTVCRRQNTQTGLEILRVLQPLNLHGFGFKKTGLKNGWDLLTSADSLAWSFAARKKSIQLEGCTHKKCANCLKFALQWRKEILNCPKQLNLF